MHLEYSTKIVVFLYLWWVVSLSDCFSAFNFISFLLIISFDLFARVYFQSLCLSSNKYIVCNLAGSLVVAGACNC